MRSVSIRMMATSAIMSLALFFLASSQSLAEEATLGAPIRPMNFALVQDGDCQQSCIQWISAEGTIMRDTPRLFERFLKRLEGRKLPVVVQSYGGDVDAALVIGRMIRRA